MTHNAIPDFTDDVICKRTPAGIETNIPHRIIYHSPTGMEWGFEGSGPADFALNILSVFIGEEAARHNGLYQEFKRDFVSRLPQRGGTIPRADILKWIEVQAAEGKIRQTVTIKLEDHDAAALGLFLSKISMETIGHFTANNDDLHNLYETLETIRDQLWEKGYNPADVPQMGVTG